MKFRQYRGSLTDSLGTVVDLPDREALIAHCRALLKPFGFEFPDEALTVARYASDPSIGWDPQSLVSIHGYGVMGMIDCSPDQLSTTGPAGVDLRSNHGG